MPCRAATLSGGDRLVDQCAHQRAQGTAGLNPGHQDGNQLFLRIDPEGQEAIQPGSRGCACPARKRRVLVP